MDNNRKNVLGVPVDSYQQDELLLRIDEGLKNSGVKTIFSVNAEKIMLARKDPELLSILEKSDFLIPDGFGAVVGLRILHGDKVGRITGVSLMKTLFILAEKRSAKVFLFGAKPDVVEIAAEKIEKKHPSLKLVGVHHGYMEPEGYKNLVERINELRTDILFVGLGSPKQEKWIAQHKHYLKTKFCMGVGGSFDVVAGKVPLAPAWISRIYLEWLYRLTKEPSRIKRQKVIPIFILNVLKEALFRRTR